MPEESQNRLDSVLQNVRTDRRAFLRALIVGGAGAAAAMVPLSSEVDAARWFNRGSKGDSKGAPKGGPPVDDGRRWFNRDNEDPI